MTGVPRAPGFGGPAILAGAALALGLPVCWAAWSTPGRLGSLLEVVEARGADLAVRWAPALTGPLAAGQWVALGVLLAGLTALAVVAGTTRSPRTRPAPRVVGAALTVLAALLGGAALAWALPQLSASLWFPPVLFPVALLVAPAGALCSGRYALALGACCAVAAAGGVVVSGAHGPGPDVPVPVPDLVMAIAVGAGAFVAASAGARAHHPAQLVTGGLLVGGAQALAMLGALWFVAPGGLPAFGELGGTVGLGVAAGAGQGLLLRLALPLFERSSDRISAVAMARWADPHHPLLTRLKREAPGTFHHSQAVGELAARAALAVGADATVCRVGGYYHDIGKIRRPDAFGENTPDTCHRELSPGESASLILAHVRDGDALALEYGLPVRLRTFILEHHGTTIVEFFYNKAKERAMKGEERAPRRADYTYAGPRPQSVESALVMLADSAEASSRSLENPSLAEIRDLVEKIYRNKLGAFQFDECAVSNAELAVAREIFVAELAASRHTRPQYPDTEYPTQAISKQAVPAVAGDGAGP